MIDKVYEIIDEIGSSKLKRRLDIVKEKIKMDKTLQKIIDDFELAKENYEKYNIKDEFLKAKNNLFSNEVLKEYVTLQNEVNLLTLDINNRIKKITEGITNKK